MAARTLLIGLAATLASSCVTFSPQTRHITAAYFADPDPALTLRTPAFEDPHGFTKHAELLAYLESLRAVDPSITVDSLGTSQKGRSIPIVFVPATEEPRVRVWMQGGLHGDEPGSSEGMLALLGRLAEGSDLAEVRRYADIAIVPVANVDGYEAQSRYAANGLDLNRDQTKLMVPESALLRRAFVDFDPQVAVDFHEYRPYRRDFVWFGENGTTGFYDVMFLYSGNLNVPEPLRALTDEVFVQAARESMDAHGLTHHPYVTTREVAGDVQFNQGSSNARSSATSFALSRTVSTLVEVRGVGLGRDGFERRVKTTLWVAEAYLRTAVAEAETVQRVLAEAPDPAQVTVTSAPTVERGTVQMIDLMPREVLDADVVIRDNLRSRAVLARERPVAYLLLPEAADLALRLQILGVAVETVNDTTPQSVERYVVRDYRRDPERYEGMRRQTVHTDVDLVSRALPPGTLRVSMDQPRANLAAEILEPEAPNSFVSFGVWPTEAGAELPIYRSLAP